jgi:hypothetical protein
MDAATTRMSTWRAKRPIINSSILGCNGRLV